VGSATLVRQVGATTWSPHPITLCRDCSTSVGRWRILAVVDEPEPDGARATRSSWSYPTGRRCAAGSSTSHPEGTVQVVPEHEVTIGCHRIPYGAFPRDAPSTPG